MPQQSIVDEVYLMAALADWFETPLRELPDQLRGRANELLPFNWDDLSPARRRDVAQSLDNSKYRQHQKDPAFIEDLVQHKHKIDQKIAKYESANATTVTEIMTQDAQIAKLRGELNKIVELQREVTRYYDPAQGPPVNSDDDPASDAKCEGHLNHDIKMQQRANEIAEEIMAVTKRRPTKGAVAKKLAIVLGGDHATVERRIRKEW